MVLVSLCGAIILAGCPFEFDTPVAAPSAESFDSTLLGIWSSAESDGEQSIFSIRRFNEAEYLIESFSISGAELTKVLYRGYMVTIAGQQFLQMNHLGPDAGFFLVRVAIVDDAMTVRFVGDKDVPKELKSNTPKLVEFIGKNLEGTKLDGEDEPIVLHRMGAVTTAAQK